MGYPKVLSAAERTLRWGGTVVAPTDTVYGILGDATKAAAIKKIFGMKGRPREKALPVFVKDITAARKYAYISDVKAKFLEKVWPGSVTVVFQHKEKLPRILTGGLNTIGIRIPSNEFLLKLLSQLDFPLVQTSANVFGKSPARNVKEIKEYFGKSEVGPDLIIDGGELGGEPSVVIDFTVNEPIILRTGVISRAKLDALLDSVK